MSTKWFRFALPAVFAAALLAMATSSAQAGSIVLGQSGWKATWSSAFDDSAFTHVTLSVLAETSDAVVLQKVAVFADGADEFGLITPIEINFEQLTADAVSNIVITSENVTNATGLDWGGFRLIIEGGTTGTPADPHFASWDPFSISPFTTITPLSPYGQVQELAFGGGVLPDGDIWTPGVVAGQVVIAAAPSEQGTTRFVLKEQPLPIPLPAAAWMGITGLIGLALPRAARKVRETLA